MMNNEFALHPRIAEGKKMSKNNQTMTPTKNRWEPLYASPWIALFFMLRQGLTQASKSTQDNACA